DATPLLEALEVGADQAALDALLGPPNEGLPRRDRRVAVATVGGHLHPEVPLGGPEAHLQDVPRRVGDVGHLAGLELDAPPRDEVPLQDEVLVAAHPDRDAERLAAGGRLLRAGRPRRAAERGRDRAWWGWGCS